MTITSTEGPRSFSVLPPCTRKCGARDSEPGTNTFSRQDQTSQIVKDLGKKQITTRIMFFVKLERGDALFLQGLRETRAASKDFDEETAMRGPNLSNGFQAPNNFGNTFSRVAARARRTSGAFCSTCWSRTDFS